VTICKKNAKTTSLIVFFRMESSRTALSAAGFRTPET
jgi:hypothetical protein